MADAALVPATATGQQQLVVVHHAETGRSFQLTVESSGSPVANLSTALEPATGIPYAHQILLVDGMKLEEDRVLSEYGLPAPDRPIFLFSRRSLSRNAPPPDRHAVPPFELEEPSELTPGQQPRSLHDVQAVDVPPLARALLDYERHFCLHLVQARSISEVGGARLATSSQCMHELHVQGAAQRAAAANLRSFAQQLANRYAEFEAQCATVIPQEQELVHSFEADVEALRAVTIDEAVCTLEGWSQATLLDACGEDKLRAWLVECQQTTEHLIAKQTQFQQAWAELQAGVADAEEHAGAVVPPTEVAVQLQEAAAVRAQQEEVVARIATDAQEVRVLVDAQLLPAGGEPPSQASLLEACGAIDSKNSAHTTELLPRLRELDCQLRAVQEAACAAKHDASLNLYHRLRAISQLQSLIAELRNKLGLLGLVFGRVQMYCSQLHLMRQLPATYHACLEEVLTRQRVQESASAQIRSTAEAIAVTREAEIVRRDEFMRTHGAMLPRGLPNLSALLQTRPPYVEISTSASDMRLMDLSTAIERTGGPSRFASVARLSPAAAALPMVPTDGSSGSGGGAGAGVTQDHTQAPSPARGAPLLQVTHGGDAAAASFATIAAPAASAADSQSVDTRPIPPPVPDDPSRMGVPLDLQIVDPRLSITDDGSMVEATDDTPASPQPPPPPPASSPTPTRPAIVRSFSEHSALHRTGSTGRTPALWSSEALAALDGHAATLGGRAGGMLVPAREGVAREGAPGVPRRVLTDPVRLPGTAELSAALEALGTPMEGMPVEVASQLQLRLAAQEHESASLRKQCASLTASRDAAADELATLREANEALLKQLNQQAPQRVPQQLQQHEHSPGHEQGQEHTEEGKASPQPSPHASIEEYASATVRSTASGSMGAAVGGSVGDSVGDADGPGGGEARGLVSVAVPGSASSASLAGLESAIDQVSPAALPTLAAASGAPEASSPTPLRLELVGLEERHRELNSSHEALLTAVRLAMSCLPPPNAAKNSGGATTGGASSSSNNGNSMLAHRESSRIPADPGGLGGSETYGVSAEASNPVDASGLPAVLATCGLGASSGGMKSPSYGGGSSSHSGTCVSDEASPVAVRPSAPARAGDSCDGAASLDGNAIDRAPSDERLRATSAPDDIQRLASQLVSSARQAAYANSRLGHGLATEREGHKSALAQAQRRLGYLSADVNARLLFTAQPAKHASPPLQVAFAALILPTMRHGLSTHWLSAESVESLRRWCEEESVPLQSLRSVVGRVVHVAGPFTVPSAGGGDNPFSLPAGEQYFVVHAEMMMQHRWIQ